MADAPYLHSITVRYGEVDQQGVVFNSHYLAWCDDAMETWLRSLAVDMPKHTYDFMLKKAVVEWQGSATNGERVEIAVAPVRWGKTSFDIGFRGTVEGRPVFSATITYVGVKFGTKEPVAPPAEFRAALGDPVDLLGA